MKKLLLSFLILPFLLSMHAQHCHAQSFCFYDPNTGPLFHNGSVGGNYDVTAGDFNEDGHVDIVTANSTGQSISFIPGLGNGMLGAPDTFPVVSTLFAITSGDFNNDGHFDVAAASSTIVFVLFGNGDGTFQPYTSYFSGNNPSRIYYLDVSGDGIGDLVEACGNGVAFLQGLANGSFSNVVIYPTGGEVYDLTIGHFNGDTIPDIVCTTRTGWTTAELSYLEGLGNGSFAADVAVPVPHYSVFGITSTDVDSNGTVDLLVTNNNNSNHRVEVYTGNGNGTFNAPVFYPVLYNPTYIYLADADNDGLDDIFVSEGSGFSILKGIGGGTFDDYEYFIAASNPNSLALTDFNEDGWLDVVVPSGTIGAGYIGMRLSCIATNVNENEMTFNLALYPNPFHSASTLHLSNISNASLKIYNTLGSLVKQQIITSENTAITREGLSTGIYFLIVKSGEIEWRERVVVE
jgi:hypothetical protein